MKRCFLLGLFFLVMFALVACQADISRNPDGSLRLEVEIPEAALASEIESAIADPLVEELSVDLRSGYLWVETSRRRLDSDQRDNLSFRLELGAERGQLTAVVSQVVVDGFTISQDRVRLWNQRIASRLERAGSRSEATELIAVEVEPTGLRLIWRVETARSRN